MPDTQLWLAVLTVVGAVYARVTLGGRHGSIPHRARIGSRGWHCFFPVRDRTTQEGLRLRSPRLW